MAAPNRRRRMPKLIFSRKGFDSGYGGMPSPILPDGRMIALPIPSDHDRARTADIGADRDLLAHLLSDLGHARHSLRTRVHLDPDLVRGPRPRPPGWRPALGQTGSAQAHLAAQGVGRGDVFLFFGWFRAVEKHRERWRYARAAPDLHVLFGWLEVGAILPVVTRRAACLARHPWIRQHPHVANPAHYADPRNTLYVARTRSALAEGLAGGGRFARFDAALRLTADGATRSTWTLPAWFMPKGDRVTLSYHADPSRWCADGDRCRLNTVAKGQEFVCRPGAEGLAWLARLVRSHGAEMPRPGRRRSA
jgi:Nucleotide modification associated domain 3